MSDDKMLKTLNPHQRAYVDLDLANPKNGKYMLGVFHLVPEDGLNILQAACEVAAESSTGTNFLVKTETPFSKRMNAMVYKVDEAKKLVYIACGGFSIGTATSRTYSHTSPGTSWA